MNTLNQLEDLIGQEYLVNAGENLVFCTRDEDSIQADNNRIVDLSNLSCVLDIAM